MSRRDEVVREVTAHVPHEPVEAGSRRRTLALLRWLPRPFDESADPTHVTGSAIVLSQDGRVLLHRHKRLGVWLQPGGHLESGELPAAAAVRETAEETGIEADHPPTGPALIHVDVHEGPRGHVHLDLRYLLSADPEEPFAPAPGESEAIAWLPIEEACAVGDASMTAAVWAAERKRGAER